MNIGSEPSPSTSCHSVPDIPAYVCISPSAFSSDTRQIVPDKFQFRSSLEGQIESGFPFLVVVGLEALAIFVREQNVCVDEVTSCDDPNCHLMEPCQMGVRSIPIELLI